MTDDLPRAPRLSPQFGTGTCTGTGTGTATAPPAGGTPDAAIRSVEFRREREPSWRELEEILDLVDRRGLKALSEDQLYRLPTLYRGAVSSLSVARTITLDRALIAYLDNLAARAYVHVYGGQRGFGRALLRFVAHRFPAEVWRHRRAVAVAMLLIAAAAVTGFQATRSDPDLFFSFIPEGLSQGREPSSSREELAAVLRSGPEEGAGGLTYFSSFLFVHNAGIGLLCFPLGFAAGVPVALLLFSNGLMLGAFAALYHSHDLGVELWGWLLPHGITEILAVALCGAAGLTLGMALVFPGRQRRLDALASAGRRAAAVVAGTVPMFLLAGLIEGYFRQLVTDLGTRYAVAVATAVLWLLYFAFHGRRAAARDATDAATTDRRETAA